MMLLCATALAATPAPVLFSPTAGSSSSTPLLVHYELPEAAGSGTATLSFKEGEAPLTVVTLAGAEDTAGQHTVSLQTHNLTANGSEVSSAAPANELADGTYELTLTYQNVALEPAAATTVKEVQLDTATGMPTLTAPANEAALEGAFAVSYELPEAALAGSVQLKFELEEAGTSLLVLTNAAAGKHSVEIKPAGLLLEAGIASGPAKLAPGRYTLRLQYQDALGNPLASTGPVKVTVLADKCAAGTYSEDGRVPCTKASPGHYVEETGAKAQIPCRPGTYNAVVDSALASACVEAEAGHYVSLAGASSQQPCPAGQYAEGTAAIVCLPAGLGHYVATEGASSQLECAAGTYAPFSGASHCAIAPAGTYAPAGARAPIACAAATEAPAEGSSVCAPVAKPAGPPPAQPGPEAQQPSLKCSLGAAAKLLSLSRTGKQDYRLTCNLAGTLSVRAVVTIIAGHHRVRLRLPVSNLKTVAGVASRQTLNVKLSGAARTLLRSSRARVGLAISVYAGSASAGPPLAGAALAGLR